MLANPLFSTLAIRIGGIVILTECVVFALVGGFYTRSFEREVEEHFLLSLAKPAALLQSGLLDRQKIAERQTLERIVGSPIRNSFLVGANDEVLFSTHAASLGKQVQQVSEFSLHPENWKNSRGPIFLELDVPGGSRAVHVSPLSLGDDSPGYLYLEAEANGLEEDVSRVFWSFAAGSAICVLLTAALIYLAFRAMVQRRLRDVLETIDDIGRGRFSARAPQSRSFDEISQLQRGVNSMAEQLQDRDRQIGQVLQASEVANRAKSEFLANVSHELRTPLNAIIGFSDIMAQGVLGEVRPPKYREYTQDIRKSARYLLGIINQLLDLSHMDSGSRILEETELDLGEVVADAEMMVRERYRHAGVTLAVEVPAGRHRIFADRGALIQVLLNLLSNACKFTPRGGHVVVSAGIGSDGGCRLSVSDSGIGIPEHQIHRLLEPFAQGEDCYVRGHEGLGLGLAIVRGLIELHGGSLSLCSEEGRGTRVEVSMPPERVIRSSAKAEGAAPALNVDMEAPSLATKTAGA